MSKKGKVFIKIIYYGFTFMIGILLAVVLPNWYMYDLSMSNIEESLNNREYSDAMSLVGGYYNKIYIYQEDFDDGGGIVLFEAATLVYNSGEEEDSTVDESKLHKSYAGFIYGIKNNYDVVLNSENKTKLIVTNSLGVENYISLLDYDSDNDGNKDNISTLNEKGFIYLDLDQETCDSLSKLTFLDKNGNTFIEVDLNLKYEEAFFTDVNTFLEEYNTDYTSSKLAALDEEFRSLNPNYMTSSYGNSQKEAMRKSINVVVIYFIAIYMVADILIGRHYIIRFFKFILVKVFKVKFKEKKTNISEASFGHDYYSQVTVSLDINEVPDFNDSVYVRYQTPDQIIEFVLLKKDNYTAKKRIKAGVYPNPWIELSEDYKAVNLPSNLVVEGYKMNVVIKIIKVEKSYGDL